MTTHPSNLLSLAIDDAESLADLGLLSADHTKYKASILATKLDPFMPQDERDNWLTQFEYAYKSRLVLNRQ